MTDRGGRSTPVAIVTGAARGLGLDIARRLLWDGMDVTMADVDEAVHAAAVQCGERAHAPSAMCATPAMSTPSWR